MCCFARFAPSGIVRAGAVVPGAVRPGIVVPGIVVRTGIIAVGILALLSFATGRAEAALLTSSTSSGSILNSLPVSAEATFTTSTNQIVIVLTNLQADPRSEVENLSGLRFMITTGQINGSLTSSSGVERTINSNKTFLDGGTKSTGWSLSEANSTFTLSVLDTPTAPNHTIIGPPGAGNKYVDANPSITNGVHSPFFGLSATFTLNIPGVTASSQVKNVVFSFNTDCGYDICGNTSSNPPVPEPATLGLLGIPFLALRRRR